MTLFTSLFPFFFYSGFWTGWLMITGGQCKFSSSVQIKSSDRSFPSFYFCYCTNKQMFNIPFCLINASVVFMIFFLFFLYLCFPRCSRGCVFMSYRGCDRFTPISTCSLEWKTGLSNSHLNPKIKTHPQRHVQGLFNFLSLLPPVLTTWTAQWRTSAADRVSPALLKLFCPSWSMESNPTANT